MSSAHRAYASSKDASRQPSAVRISGTAQPVGIVVQAAEGRPLGAQVAARPRVVPRIAPYGTDGAARVQAARVRVAGVQVDGQPAHRFTQGADAAVPAPLPGDTDQLRHGSHASDQEAHSLRSLG